MKLTYWVAECLDDSKAYNIRARLKTTAVQMRKVAVKNGGEYGPVFKATIEYSSAYHLVNECLCEGGGYWEVPE